MVQRCNGQEERVGEWERGGVGDGEILNSKAPFVWLVNHVYEHADNLFVFIK
jgi:hypothetical protein